MDATYLYTTTPDNAKDAFEKIQNSDPCKMLSMMGVLHNSFRGYYEAKGDDKASTIHHWVSQIFNCMDNRIVRKHDDRYGRLIPGHLHTPGEPIWKGVPNEVFEYCLKLYNDPNLHPIIKSRLSDFFWESHDVWKTYNITGMPKKIDFGRQSVSIDIEAAIWIGKQSFDDPLRKSMYSAGHWERAVEMGIKINHLDPVKDSIDALQDEVEAAVKEKNLWVLTNIEIEVYLRRNMKGSKQKEIITDDRLRYLAQLCDSLVNADFITVQPHLPHDVIECKEKIEVLLGNEVDQQKKCLSRAEAFVRYADSQEDHIVKACFFQQAIPLFYQAGERDKANDLLVKIREENKMAFESDSMNEASATIEFDQETIEGMCKDILDGAGELCEAITKMACRTLMPALEKGTYFEDSYGTGSIMSQFAVIMPVVDDRSQKQIMPGSDETKIHDKNRMLHLELEMTSSFLCNLFAYLEKNFEISKESFLECLKLAPNYSDDDVEYLSRIFDNYYAQDVISCLHILTPHLERLIRRILKAKGISFTSYDQGALRNKPLGELLREGLSGGIFSREIHKLLEATLSTEDYGWNIRNKIAHGDIKAEEFTPHKNYRLMHIMFILYHHN